MGPHEPPEFDPKSIFYRASLTTGRAVLVGGFDEPVFDIAVPLNQ